MVDLKQKIQDLLLIAKNDRKVLVGAGALVLIIVLTLFTNSPRPRSFKVEQANQPIPAGVGVAQDIVTAYKQDLDTLKKKSKDLDESADRMEKQLAENTEKTSGVLEILTDKMEELQKTVAKIEQQQNQPPAQTAVVDTIPPPEDGLEGFGETGDTGPPSPPPIAPKFDKIKFISPGDACPATLLTGVAAPVDGTPYPVVLALKGPCKGPDGSTLDLGEARLIAAAQGSETDGRVLFRLTNLAMRQQDGSRLVVKVDGWVVGEDGVRGMTGKLIDKLGPTIAAVGAVSFAAGVADSVADQAESDNDDDGGDGLTINTGDVNEAAASAFNNSSQLLGKVIIDRYQKLVPVVEVLSGREAAVVFSQAAEIAPCEDEDCGSVDFTYASLD